MSRLGANQLGSAAILLGVAQVTSSQGSITGTLVDLTGLSLTVTTDGVRNVRIQLGLHMYSTVGGDFYTLQFMEGATIIHMFQGRFQTNSGQESFTFTHTFASPPSAGSHTYKVQLARASGSGTVNTFSSSDRKDTLTVEHV